PPNLRPFASMRSHLALQIQVHGTPWMNNHDVASMTQLQPAAWLAGLAPHRTLLTRLYGWRVHRTYQVKPSMLTVAPETPDHRKTQKTKSLFIRRIMSRIAVIYYSSTGATYTIAQAYVEGATEAGAEVRLRRAAELAPQSVIDSNEAWAAHQDETKH